MTGAALTFTGFALAAVGAEAAFAAAGFAAAGFAAAGVALTDADARAGFAPFAFSAGALDATGFAAGAFPPVGFAAVPFTATGLVATSFVTGFAAVVLTGTFGAIGLVFKAGLGPGLTGAEAAFVGAEAAFVGAEAAFVGAEAALGAGAGFVLALVVPRIGVLAWATIRVLLAPGRPESLAVG
ncbi:MAG: hypothetical protein WEE67_11335 [Chloroflexota bacterium]